MKLIIAAVALSMALGSAALAQPRHDPHRGASNHSRYAPPKHWNQSRDHWDRHTIACQKRYRSYNPRTDRYTISRGRTAICRL